MYMYLQTSEFLSIAQYSFMALSLIITQTRLLSVPGSVWFPTLPGPFFMLPWLSISWNICTVQFYPAPVSTSSSLPLVDGVAFESVFLRHIGKIPVKVLITYLQEFIFTFQSLLVNCELPRLSSQLYKSGCLRKYFA